MRVSFRADASNSIGTGHVVRCLTLAAALANEGAEVGFISEELPRNLQREITHRGFELQGPNSTVRDMDWLVVDHYRLDEAFESSMRARARRILVIDDLMDRRHDCDILLNQNFLEDMELRYAALVGAETKKLLGPRYALLRPEFAAARPRARRRSTPRTLFVFFGGSDPTRETEKALLAVKRLGRADLRVEVLVGAASERLSEIERLAAALPNAAVTAHTERISDRMIAADLALGAGGTTSWERCCLGLPALVVAVAANQEELSRTLAAHGYQRYLGAAEDIDVEVLASALAEALEHFEELAEAGRRGMELVDGLGTQRVVRAMLEEEGQ